MEEVLITTWSAIMSILSSLWNLVEVIAVWSGTVLYQLHTEAPRLEGLLVGILLTWFLMRRERHPVLRLLSAPLKLVVDIMDLVWDQIIESCGDLKETIASWWNKAATSTKRFVGNIGTSIMTKLRVLKEKLTKSKNEEEA